MHCMSTAVYSALDAKPKQVLDSANQISVALLGSAGRERLRISDELPLGIRNVDFGTVQ